MVLCFICLVNNVCHCGGRLDSCDEKADVVWHVVQLEAHYDCNLLDSYDWGWNYEAYLYVDRVVCHCDCTLLDN